METVTFLVLIAKYAEDKVNCWEGNMSNDGKWTVLHLK